MLGYSQIGILLNFYLIVQQKTVDELRPVVSQIVLWDFFVVFGWEWFWFLLYFYNHAFNITYVMQIFLDFGVLEVLSFLFFIDVVEIDALNSVGLN